MRWVIGCLIYLMVAGCVNQPEQYKPAGFSSVDEVYPYLGLTNYLAIQLTPHEWDDFYKRFPDYWKDLQLAKTFGGTLEYHPWYTAYAFRWTTLNKKKPTWSTTKIMRLDAGTIENGDTPFEIFYAKGAPQRLLWDNDFEILIY